MAHRQIAACTPHTYFNDTGPRHGQDTRRRVISYGAPMHPAKKISMSKWSDQKVYVKEVVIQLDSGKFPVKKVFNPTTRSWCFLFLPDAQALSGAP